MLLRFAEYQVARCGESAGPGTVKQATAHAAIQGSATAIEAKVLDLWLSLVEPPRLSGSGERVGRYSLPESLRSALASWMPLHSRTVAVEERLDCIFENVFRLDPPRGHEPFQSWKDLRTLRNAVTHYRPAWATAESGSNEFEPADKVPKSLLNRFSSLTAEIDEFTGLPPAWPTNALTLDIAAWALLTAKNVFEAIDEAEQAWSEDGYCDPNFYK